MEALLRSGYTFFRTVDANKTILEHWYTGTRVLYNEKTKRYVKIFDGEAAA